MGAVRLRRRMVRAGRSGRAQPLPQAVTLREALRRAQADAPAVAAAAATYALREAEVGAARGAYFPSLTVEGTSGYAFNKGQQADVRQVDPLVADIQAETFTNEAHATLRWAALDLVRGARVDAAEQAARAQSYTERTTQRDAMLLAAELYVRAAAAAALTKDAELSFERRGAAGAGGRRSGPGRNALAARRRAREDRKPCRRCTRWRPIATTSSRPAPRWQRRWAGR